MMQSAAPKTEYLSSEGEDSPRLVLEAVGEQPVVLCMVAIWTRGTMTGHLDEKGAWVQAFWERALAAQTETFGCRLGWNSLFLALPGTDLERAAMLVGSLLRLQLDPCLMSYCVLCPVDGSVTHNLDVLDVLGHEVSSQRDFGDSREYRPDGHRFHHLLDGKPFSTK